jgi:hypothetical protein
MSGIVIDLPVITRLNIDPDRVLNRAVGECETVIVFGYTHAGEEYFASSVADGGTVLWLLERMKKQILSTPDEDQ